VINRGVFSNAPDSAARGFIYSSILWLLLGCGALALTAAKLVSPDFLSTEILSYSRVRAIASIALIYGWLTQGALAAIFYTIPRVTGARMRTEGSGQLAGILINGSLFIGVFATLLAGPRGRTFQELPGWLAIVLMAALGLAAATVVRTLQARVEPKIYPSVLFLTAASIWAPLSLAAGTIPRFSGAAAGIAHMFSLSSYLLLFLGSSLIGSILYLVPRSTGAPLYSRRLGLIGFVSLAIAAPLSSQVMFGPAPDWLETITVAASIALLIPLATVIVNLLGTLQGAWSRVPDHPSLKFFVGAVVVLAIALVHCLVQSLRSVSQVVGLTDWQAGQVWLLILAFSLGFAGSITFAFPRLIGRRWFDRSAVTGHFWTSVAGSALMAVGIWGAGLVSGLLWRAAARAGTPAITGEGFAAALHAARPFRSIFLAGTLVFGFGQLLFASNLLRSTTRGEPRPIEVVAQAEAEL
jgi:cbb3-type cytochrome oxidase subunit 1